MESSKLVGLQFLLLLVFLIGLKVSSKTIKEGDSETIACGASMPNLLRRTWAKGFFNAFHPPSYDDILFVLVPPPGPLKRVNARVDMTVNTDNFSLTIGDVKFEDEGFFTCIAENVIGVRKYFQSEEYIIGPLPTVEVAFGSPAEIHWNIESTNDYLVRLWLKGQHTDIPADDTNSILIRQVSNELPELPSSRTAVHLPSFSLITPPVGADDAGFYTAMQMDEQGQISYRFSSLVVQSPKDCQELYQGGVSTSGVYTISPDGTTFTDVYCEQELDNGGWTVFQRRVDGSVDFYRKWKDYQEGFGNSSGEYWLGNDNLFFLTMHRDTKLKVELNYKGEIAYADYSRFWVGDAGCNYRLHVGEFSGADPPRNSLAHQNGSSFTTRDKDNDSYLSGNCALVSRGAWWYSQCGQSNLNGVYGDNEADNWNMEWNTWKSREPMTATRMMVKRI